MAESSAMTKRRFMIGLLLGMGGALCYGVNIVFAQMSAHAGIHGSVILFYRVFLMLPLAVIAMWISVTPFRIEKSETRAIVMMGVTSSAVSLCYILSVAYIPVTIAAVIFYTFPILVVLATPFVENKVMQPMMLVVAVVAFTGIVIVLGPDQQGLDPVGLILAGCASLSASVQFFYGTRSPLSPTMPKLIIIQIIMFPAALLIMLLNVGLPSLDLLMLAPWASALTMGGYALGFLLQIMALNRISPTAAGLVFCLEPVIAALSAHVILDEQLSMLQYSGGVMVVLAIVISIIQEHQALKKSDQSATQSPTP
jgi:drug/metabolite transporter (DMT)-like permease